MWLTTAATSVMYYRSGFEVVLFGNVLPKWNNSVIYYSVMNICVLSVQSNRYIYINSLIRRKVYSG